MANKFNFVGTLVMPKSDSKRPFCRDGKTKNGSEMLNMTFGVKEGQSNIAFVEAFDFKRDIIRTMNTNNEKIEVAWQDRNNEDVVHQIAFYRKNVIDLGEEFGGRREFASQYDALEHLRQWLPQYQGKVCVTGMFEKEWYKDRYMDKFKFQNVYAVTDDAKECLSLSIDIFYNKNSVDKTEFKETQKVFINGYIEQYINSTEKNRFIPHQFVLSTAKYNLENELHKKHLEYKMRMVDISEKKMHHMLWDVVLMRGAQQVDFDESMLTDLQKEQIELGFKVLEDFRPNGPIQGGKINEYRLRLPILKGNFADGLLDTDMKESEFEDLLHVPTASVEAPPAAEIKPEAESKEENESSLLDLNEEDFF